MGTNLLSDPRRRLPWGLTQRNEKRCLSHNCSSTLKGGIQSRIPLYTKHGAGVGEDYFVWQTSTREKVGSAAPQLVSSMCVCVFPQSRGVCVPRPRAQADPIGKADCEVGMPISLRPGCPTTRCIPGVMLNILVSTLMRSLPTANVGQCPACGYMCLSAMRYGVDFVRNQVVPRLHNRPATEVERPEDADLTDG